MTTFTIRDHHGNTVTVGAVRLDDTGLVALGDDTTTHMLTVQQAIQLRDLLDQAVQHATGGDAR